MSVQAVAALASGSDLTGLLKGPQTLPGGGVFATYMLQAYADHCDDISLGAYVRPGARVSFDDLTTGPLVTRIEQNIPPGPSMPAC